MSLRKHIASQPKVVESGFTLIELLIVIVIIGILAGVVIGVLNPVAQQNRARDASIRSQIDKMALSGKSLYVSSLRTNDRSPTHAEFIQGVGGSTAEVNCTSTDATEATAICAFSITGVPLPAGGTTGCAATPVDYSGTAVGGQCKFGFWRDGTSFRVIAKGYAAPQRTFIYSYLENATGIVEGFFSCSEDWDVTVTPVGAAACDNLLE